MIADPLHIDPRAPSGVLCTGSTSPRSLTTSPKDRNKLSINFLSDERPRADSANYSRSHSSVLSTRARGVNRQDVQINNSENVEVATEASGSPSRSYRLEIVQHPDRTAEFGASTLTRLPLAPPLIAQLVMRDAEGQSVLDEAELPFLVAQLSLLNGEGGAPMDYAGGGAGAGAGAGRGGAQERLLYGSLVSSPHLLRNLQGRRGAYFMFPDVAVRQCGRFQLKVTLIRLPRFDDPALLTRQRPDGTIVAEARSLPFDVFPRRDYVAPAQTPLTQYFLQQGARMIVPPPRSL